MYFRLILTTTLIIRCLVIHSIDDSSNFLLTTLSMFGENDLLELKMANLFLRSRLLWSGSLSNVSCLWTVVPIKERHINLNILRQASHIASECRCRLHISNFYLINNPDEIVYLAIREATMHYKNSTVLYLSSNSIIINDPTSYLPSNFDKMVAVHVEKTSTSNQCGLTAILLSSEFARHIHSILYYRNFNLCKEIHRYAATYNYTIADIPHQLRYSMILDDHNLTLNNLSILLATSSAGLVVNLHQVRLPDQLTTYAIGHNYYNCEYKLLAPWKWNHDKTTILESPLSQAFEMLNLSTLTIPQFCRNIFGTILPDEKEVEVDDITVRDTAAVVELVPPEWMLDLRVAPPRPRDDDQNHKYSWNDDKDPSEKEKQEEEYQLLLDTTVPKLIWHKDTITIDNCDNNSHFLNSECRIDDNFKTTINRTTTTSYSYPFPSLPSECSLQFFAVGSSYLATAFLQASHYRSMLSTTPHPRCGNHTPNLVLYTDRFTLHKNTRYELFSNWSDTCYLHLFDAIFEVSDHPKYLHHWLPMPVTPTPTTPTPTPTTMQDTIKNHFHDTLRRTGLDVFHHSPVLWWYRLSAFLHPPSRFVVAIESEVFSCVQNFDLRLFDAIHNYDIVTIIDRSEPNGGSNGDANYPYPDNHLTSAWISFEERLLCFLIFDSSQPVVKKLFQATALAYSRQVRSTYLGRTFVRGDQTAFREGLFHVRHQIREKALRTETTDIFCFRWYRYRSSCELYHGYDAAKRCLVTSTPPPPSL